MSDTPPNPAQPPASSRRDFLRRASKEAAQDAIEIGSKVVPGIGLAARFVKGDKPSEPDADATTTPDAPKRQPVWRDPLGWLARWRDGRK